MGRKYINLEKIETSCKNGVVSGNSKISLDSAFFIFDLDGTFYRLEEGFTKSRFYQDLKERIYSFFMQRLKITRDEAMLTYERVNLAYNGEVSLGVEKELGIDRYDFFANTWNLNPVGYVKKEPLRELLLPFKGRSAVLTSAPKIWASRVLGYLEVSDIFEEALFTGEPDIRKPDKRAFQQILDRFGIKPERAISVGDQEATDILPAKSLGMKTVIVGVSKIADFEIKSLRELGNVLR